MIWSELCMRNIENKSKEMGTSCEAVAKIQVREKESLPSLGSRNGEKEIKNG